MIPMPVIPEDKTQVLQIWHLVQRLTHSFPPKEGAGTMFYG